MNIINLFKKGKIKKIFLGMELKDFFKASLSKKITDKIYYNENDYNEILFHTSSGIEVIFLNNKINSISIDPNYKNIKINKLKINRNTSIVDILKSFFDNDIEWKFGYRDKYNECEIITTKHNISLIFVFDRDDFWLAKLILSA